MSKRRTGIAIGVLGAVLGAVTWSATAAAELEVGSSRLGPIGGSGIRARAAFLDTGHPATGLIVSAVATGLDPSQTYFSLVYDTGSAITGPLACLPTGPSLTADQMNVGFWKVSPRGEGTLFAVKQGDSYVPLDEIGAISIRIVLGPPPEGFVLQACGGVRSIPRLSAGP
jgi:hypothetical protein